MRLFSRIRVNDAEVGVHQLLSSRGYSLKVKLDHVDLGPGQLKKFPCCKPSTWFQFLLDAKRLPQQMVGVSSVPKMKAVLTEFWNRQKKLRPDHGIFRLAAEGLVDLSSLVPYFSHSDEGRSQKHLPLFIFSVHGCLGRGTRSYLDANLHKRPLVNNGMGLNFVGSTWATNYMVFAVMKTVLNNFDDALNKLLSVFTEDAAMLLHEGLLSSDGMHRFYFLHWATKGDLPALQKLGEFSRYFGNVPRAASSRKACKGVCFLCDAGQEEDRALGVPAMPFEDVRPTASWMATIGLHPAWNNEPLLLANLPLNQKHKMEFFRTDLWHNAHLGLLKHFVSSSFVAIAESDLEAIPAGSMEVKFQWLTGLYRAYFRSPPHVSEISRDTMCFPASTASPMGKWSKGAATTEMMHFLDHFGQNWILGKSNNPLLLAIVSSPKLWMHIFFAEAKLCSGRVCQCPFVLC